MCWPLNVIGAPDIIPLNFKKAIIEKIGDKVMKMFASTKNVRKEIVKAGQDVESPDFGRKKN